MIDSSIAMKCLAKKYLLNELEYKLDPSELVLVQKNLLTWYKKNRRLLPWRGDPIIISKPVSSTNNIDNLPILNNNNHAYGIWVSEVMLQQTRIETVIDYWLKWMIRFPTIKDLSLATEEEVNQYWAGLGYYRRAQQLLKGAKKIVDEYKEKRNWQSLRRYLEQISNSFFTESMHGFVEDIKREINEFEPFKIGKNN